VHAPLLGILGINPESIFDSLSPYGELALLAIVFAETGLLIGFFLPGDSLLFTAGVLAGQGKLDLSLVLTAAFIGAFVGGEVGYMIGKHLGPRLFSREESRVFKQEYVERTKEFFERHGPKTIVLARFVPIVRTATPVMAGVGSMPRRIFTAYNLVGALLWGIGVTLLGYALGDAIGDNIDTYILPLIAIVILVSFLPVLIELRKARNRPADPLPPDEAAAEAGELEDLLHGDD
jgi:membrane-associated protein